MNTRKIAGFVICLVLMMPAANAGDSDALIQLDKAWGSGMDQGAGEPNPHWSMHIWQKTDAKWQIAATASVPVGE